jgi:hypothetical protein
MAAQNPTWGASRVHGELLKLSFNLSSKGRVADSATTTSARFAIAGLRNEGLVEERVRGVIRLTALGYKKYSVV